jgi:hypothetical protein
VATARKTVVGHGKVEDQSPAARRVLEVAAELHVAAPLACACRYAVLRADRVSRPCGTAALALLPSNHAPWLHLSELCTWLCGRRESPCIVFAATSEAEAIHLNCIKTHGQKHLNIIML